MEKLKLNHDEKNLIKFIDLGSLALGLNLSEKITDKFIDYINMINLYQKKINITSVHNPYEIICKHFLDSLSCTHTLNDLIKKYIQGKKIKMIDVGSGAGFPGIPIKLVLPDTRMTLLEARKNKTLFLSKVVESLSLIGIEVIQGRAENIGKTEQYREKFHVVLSRAVAPLSVLCEYCLPLCRTGGIMVAFKGSSYAEELSNSIKVIEVLGGIIENISIIKIPNSNYLRYLLFIRKIKPTPDNYPRKNGIPSKRPLCFN